MTREATATTATTATAATTATTATATAGNESTWQRWAVVCATPVVAFVVGLLAMPNPQGVAMEQAAFDRSAVSDVVSATAPLPTSPIDATLGGVIRVRGADLPDMALSRGSRLQATLHFQVLGAVDSDWQVFVHIDPQDTGDGDGARGRINADHFPAAGRYPSSLWQSGEFVRDRFEQTIPRGAAAGVYDVWVGLYRGDARLPLTAGDRRLHDGDNRIRVGQITIE
jgi:hypothetical protein